MISPFDYLTIAFYAAFIVVVGILFSRKSSSTSDYFRGGGALPWWIAGASAWMVSFSAWTFTGAAGKIYQNAISVLSLYYSSLIPLLFLLYFTCRRFRRMRVVTPLEAVRLRFGPASQQFYTWISLPFLVLLSAVALNAVSVFVGATFGVDVAYIQILLGGIVIVISLLGGSFGVAAGDFVQMLLIVAVTVIVALLTIFRPEFNGVAGLIQKVPDSLFSWQELARPEFTVMWVAALVIHGLFSTNNIKGSTKFLMAANDKHARKMLWIPFAGTLLGPLIWLIPPMAARINHPDMAALFPQLKHPEEAAFVISAFEVLPQGMLGLLICGIFAATLTTMDAGLNQGAGIFVRNFYLPILSPQASEKHLLLTSKICTACLGILIMAVAILINRHRSLGLFDFMNQLGTSLMLPLFIPLFYGLFFRRTPGWSTWTTVLIGLATSYLVKFHTSPSLFFTPPFKPEEVTNYYIFATVAIVVSVCTAWFFFTSLFYENTSLSFRQSVDDFFQRLKTPVESTVDEIAQENHGIAFSVGKLAMIYGGFITLLALVPNTPVGRLCFLGCGGFIGGIGTGIFLLYQRRQRALTVDPSGSKPTEKNPSL